MSDGEVARKAAGSTVDDSGMLAELGVCLRGGVVSLGCYGGGVYLLDPDQHTLVLAVYTGLPPQFAGPWRRVPLDAWMAAAEAVRTRNLVWVAGQEDFARQDPRVALSMPYRFASACVPLLTGHTRHGALFFNWPGDHPARLDNDERAEVWTAAAALSHVCADAATHHPLHPPADPVVLAETPWSVHTAAPDALCSAALARLPEGLWSLGADGRITHATPACTDLLGVPAADLVGTMPWRTLPWLDHPLYEERYRAAAMSRQPSAFVALRPPDQWLRFQLYPDTSGITVRITKAPRGSTEQRPRTSNVVTPGSGRDDGAQLEAVYQALHLAGALATAGGVADIVRLVADTVLPAFGAARTLLLAPHEEHGRMHVIGAHGYPPSATEYIDRSPTAGQETTVRSLATGSPLFLERGEMIRLYPQHREISRGAAWAVLPLMAAQDSLGVWVLSYDQPHRFPVEERATLTALAGLIAQALERARRYDTTRNLARDLQNALLPQALPTLSGIDVAARYRPATQGMDIGGDFYDLIPLAHGRAGAVIGDIQGHNATAAGLMGQVRTAVRAYATGGHDPRRILARTNQLITGLDTDLLASAVYLHVDPQRHRALIARAGHPPPLLRHADGHVETVDVPGGVLLGVEPDCTYPRTRFGLPSGAVLALYTDGLTDTPTTDPGTAHAELVHRLAQAGTADTPLDDVAEALLADTTNTDDATVLLLRLASGEEPARPA